MILSDLCSLLVSRGLKLEVTLAATGMMRLNLWWSNWIVGNVSFDKKEDGLVDCFFRNEAPFCLKKQLECLERVLIYFYSYLPVKAKKNRKMI